MTNDLHVFTQLKADISQFVAPAMGIKVTDFSSAAQAIEAAKTIKMFQKQIEGKRKELTDPLEARKKSIISYAKEIAQPLDSAEIYIKSQIVAFELEQEKIRMAKQRALDEEKRQKEAEQKAVAEAALAELEAKKDLAQDAASVFGEDPVGQPDLKMEEETLLAQIEIDKKVLDIEHTGKSWENDRHGVKNARKTWDCELIDINLVPLEFQIRTLNSAAVKAAARNGVVNIPGVRIFQNTTIAIGANTYIPREYIGK